MPLYAYKCDPCGHETESPHRGDSAPCENCGATARRRFSFRTGGPTFTGHYNVAAGRYVETEGQLKSAFAEASEEQTRLTGVPVDIQPVDMRDRAACGITDADVDRLTEEKARKVAS